MMKHLHKAFAFTLTLCLALALAVPALAAAEEISIYAITVKNAQANETYSIYKMMDLTVSGDATAFSYKVNEKWVNFFTNGGAGAEYVSVDDLGHVTWKDDKKGPDAMNTFGKAAVAYLSGSSNGVSVIQTVTPTETSDITFALADPGYYIITSTNGTRVIIDTTPTNPNPEVTAKNVGPTLELKVQEGSSWGAFHSAQIGDTENFQATIHARRGALKYVYHCNLDTGLTPDVDSIQIVNTASNGPALTKDTDYTVENSGLDDDCSFHITFVQTYLDTLVDSDLVITYSATFNDDAVVGTPGNKNTSKLTWGAKSATADMVTTTYTLAASAYKYWMNGTSETALAGVSFALSENQDGSSPINFKAVAGETTPTYKVTTAAAESEGVFSEITTDVNGRFILQGLDTGTYYLKETKTPDGYNTLAGSIKVVISVDDNKTTVKYFNYDVSKAGSGGYDSTSSGIGEIRILNGTGTELPSTGGIGTTPFYVLGGILVAGAVILLVTKKRTGDRD